MFIVRVVRSTDNQKAANTKDFQHDTKNDALGFIASLGKLSVISKIIENGRKTYIITPAK